MDMKGRPRIPKVQKVLQGTFRQDRNPKEEMEPPLLTDPPSPPTSLNTEGRKFWKQYLARLSPTGVLTTVDLGAFEIVAQTYGQWKEAEAAIYRPVSDGHRKKRSLEAYMQERKYTRKLMPELVTLEKARDDFFRFAAQFGMTPAFRNKIDVAGARKKPEDEMEGLLANAD